MHPTCNAAYATEMNRYIALLVACLSSNAAAERCMTATVVSDSFSTTEDSLLYVFDDRGQVQTTGPYRYTWKDGHIVRTDQLTPKGEVALSWIYGYGTHGEPLKVTEHKPGDDWVKAEFTWTGTFGAKRTVTPTLYGSHASTSVGPMLGPIDARGPDAIFTGTFDWPGQLTEVYDHGVVTRSVGYGDATMAYTFDAKHHVVKTVETFSTGVKDIRHFRYDGDRLVYDDDKFGTEEMRHVDYSYDAQGRASKHVQSRGREIEAVVTYSYECPAK